MPAALRNSAPAMKVVLARPGEEKLSLPGSFFASSITSLTVLTGVPGKAIRNSGAEPKPGDAGKVLHRIERRVLGHEPRHGVAVRGDHQRVAVGRGLGDARGAGEARPILDDDLLAPFRWSSRRQRCGRGCRSRNPRRTAPRWSHAGSASLAQWPAPMPARWEEPQLPPQPRHPMPISKAHSSLPPRVSPLSVAYPTAGYLASAGEPDPVFTRAFICATTFSRLVPKSLSITAAAFRPGPPEIEPPGCVVEPV